jgi:hypothetical protein
VKRRRHRPNRRDRQAEAHPHEVEIEVVGEIISGGTLVQFLRERLREHRASPPEGTIACVCGAIYLASEPACPQCGEAP